MAIFPARLYKINTDVSLQWIFSAFEVKNEIETSEFIDEKEYRLTSKVSKLQWFENKEAFQGNFAYEFIIMANNLDGSKTAVVDTNFADFIFTKGSIILIVFSNYETAEKVASRINEMIGYSVMIKNCSISPEIIKQFLDENNHILKRSFWKNLKIPGVNRANLDGTNVERATDSQRYDDLGEKNYITVELIDEHITITISSRGAIGFVSSINRSDILPFLKRIIFPYIWI